LLLVLAAPYVPPSPPPPVTLAGRMAVCVWLVGDEAALHVLRNMRLPCPAPPASLLQVAVVGSAPVASCAAWLAPNLLFLGSQVGDSLLVKATRERGTTTAAAAGGHGPNPAEHPAKRRRLASLASFDMGGSEGSLRAASFSGVAAGAPAAAAAGGGGVEFGDGFGADGEWELYKSATGRSSSMKLPAISGDTLKYSLQVRVAGGGGGRRGEVGCVWRGGGGVLCAGLGMTGAA
jgi:hypothetical protein